MRKLATVLTITCGLLAGFAMPGFHVAGAEPDAGITFCTAHAWAPVRWDDTHVMGDSTIACSQYIAGLNIRSTVWFSPVKGQHYPSAGSFNNYPANPMHEYCNFCGGLGIEAVSFISEPAQGCYWWWTRVETWSQAHPAVVTAWQQSSTTFCQL